jgi:hypothetical protein
MYRISNHLSQQADPNSDEHFKEIELSSGDVRFYASQLESVELTWLMRFALVTSLETRASKRLLGTEDCEGIVDQLFPTEERDMLRPEYLAILTTSLTTEGFLTETLAKAIKQLAVSLEEFTGGPAWNGETYQRALSTQDPSIVAIFSIPTHSRTAKLPSRDPLYTRLAVLVEAAAYHQSFWRGYFFPNPRAKLVSFYDSFQANLQDDYSRNWTYREARLLQRGGTICKLLQSFDDGDLTDFGIVRTVRGTFCRLPGQPFLDQDELESFLHHRIPGSGLANSMVTEIMALHPEHDEAFSSERLRAHVQQELRDKTARFEREEEQRLKEILISREAYEKLKKREMSRWQHVKAKWHRLVGKKQSAFEAFDPFS